MMLSTGALNSNAHRKWLDEHKLLLADVGESMDVLQQFINAQQASGDACSSRLLESKRVLDGLLKDVKSLSVQVDSHEEALETETGNLNITELSIKAVETTHKEAMAACEKEKQDAAARVSQYQSELAELDQIAKPSVRLQHVTKVKVNEASEASLLQQGVWSKESCMAFVSWKHKKQNVGLGQQPSEKEEDETAERDCDTQRDELQKAFTKAYISTRDLLKEAQSDVEDTTCVDTAEAEKAADLVPLVAARELASSLIESASQSVAALEPVLALLKSRVDKLEDHIFNTLTPECKEAKEVSEALQKIRELILQLEKCPGRNDFKLKIPSSGCDETMSGTGENYRGCQDKTQSGRKCQKWTSQSPHKHPFSPTNYPEKGLGDHNYCRNPDGHRTIWCYTTDASKRWEICDPLSTQSSSKQQ